jgi:hypothetical protein
MNNYNIIFSRRPGTAELVSILFAVCALLFARQNKSTFAAIKAAWQWLFKPETYFASDGEGVTVNGLQIIGINLFTAAVCLILSISL